MNIGSAAILDETFHALSHGVRREMLRLLAGRAYRVTELADCFREISLNAVSKHVKTLERAGLVKRRKDGRIHNLRLDPAPLQGACEAIEFYREFWEQQLDALADFLETTKSTEPKPKEQ